LWKPDDDDDDDDDIANGDYDGWSIITGVGCSTVVWACRMSQLVYHKSKHSMPCASLHSEAALCYFTCLHCFQTDTSTTAGTHAQVVASK